MTTPQVSIVIPAYNAERFLAETIDSVLAQTLQCCRLPKVIVDDGSADATMRGAESYAGQDPRIRVVRQENTGQAQARNRGLAETDPQAAFIALLDHDDFWEPTALERLRQALEQDSSVVAAHGVARYVSGAGQQVQPGVLEGKTRERRGFVGNSLQPVRADAPTTFAVLIAEYCLVSPGLALIRRAALDRVGLLDTMPALGFTSLDDWDLWLRLSRLGGFAFVNQITLNYRLHDGNLSRNRRVMCLGEWYVRRKFHENTTLPPPEAQMAAVMYAEYVTKMRREMATHLRRVVYRSLAEARTCLRSGSVLAALSAAWHGASLYHRYLRIRNLARSDELLSYTEMEDALLPESLVRVMP